eukprot:3857367-Rhodomonas_salina.2
MLLFSGPDGMVRSVCGGDPQGGPRRRGLQIAGRNACSAIVSLSLSLVTGDMTVFQFAFCVKRKVKDPRWDERFSWRVVKECTALTLTVWDKDVSSDEMCAPPPFCVVWSYSVGIGRIAMEWVEGRREGWGGAAGRET